MISKFAPQLLTIADYGGAHMDMDGGWWVVMVFGMVLFWGLVGLVIYFLLRKAGSRRDQRSGSGSIDALETLDRRLAEGDITPEDYQARAAVLNKPERRP